ncbi:ferulic acid esterase [Dendryphion nanum]|uniref:Carboxylic ester hydrolase n=1 Tax=Dendryphion nanum TaxID=256645 RepID=A0A9P9IU95_9PLEO|nr:ferulic acid esterase [Dendryphion nanum]
MKNHGQTCRTLLIASLFALHAVYGACSDFQSQCLSFNPRLSLPNSNIRLVEFIPANSTLSFPTTDPTCNRPSQFFTTQACRVALLIPTSNRSNTIVEYFFPPPDTWKGRLLGTGNGGIDGCIKYEDIAYGLNWGFATTGSNNGHNGTSGEAFLNNPDVITDFSYRSKHVAAVTGKKLTEAFYGRLHHKSYYMGCSGGGRQGIQAASLYPEDYDGVLVGAPALNFNYMSAWRASFYITTGPAKSPDFINAETWKGLIHNEILKQCDELDGVKDGIINSPQRCSGIFSPDTLLCRDNSTSACLSPKQVEIVRKVYSDYIDEKIGFIYPGFDLGAEVLGTQRLLSGTPFQYSLDWFRYAVYSNATWDPASYTTADAAEAERVNPGNARTWPLSLSDFNNSGGKMLIYHGAEDQQITHANTERWYSHLVAETQTEDIDTFLRHFRVPGLAHCSSGNGAWQIGQNAQAAAGVPFTRETNVLAALIDWVENKKAPDSILGTKFVDNDPLKGVQMRRPHCKFPLTALYQGGDHTVPESWKCGAS